MSSVDTLSVHLDGVSLDWEDLLKQSRTRCGSQQHPDGLILCRYIPNIAETILHYVQVVQNLSSNTLSNASSDISGGINHESDHKNELKPLILETRRALRFGLSLFNEELSRSYVQEEAVLKHNIHIVLPSLISNRQCDTKCRTMASRLLCNLGTSNSQTANRLLCDIKISLSEKEETSVMLSYLSLKHDTDDGFNRNPTRNDIFCWGDMIYISGISGNRDAIAAISAALYNCLSSLQPDGYDQAEVNENNYYQLVCSKIAADKTLMCNLIRYILPSDVIYTSNQVIDNDSDEKIDDSTDWISRLIEKLSACGMLPQMYNTLGGSSVKSITPEQVVLLYCIRSVLEGNEVPGRDAHPLGGKSIDSICETMMFIARLWISMETDEKISSSSLRAEWYEGENLCVESASTAILEILATSFSILDESSSNIRSNVEKQTDLLQHVVLEFAQIVDRLDNENHGKKARELKISDQDQYLITALVRVIGNMCFRCRFNQDKMRDIEIPHPSMNTSSARNGLHILLSSTSLAHGCFTLREWAIVAIRNCLEDNEINQSLIEKLQAKKAVQTPELQRLGVDVQIDEKGKVRIHDSRNDAS